MSLFKNGQRGLSVSLVRQRYMYYHTLNGSFHRKVHCAMEITFTSVRTSLVSALPWHFRWKTLSRLLNLISMVELSL